MKFGLFSNGRRPDRPLREAWDLDVREMVAADAVGFEEVWISEHEAPAELIVPKVAAVTKQIKLGSGVRPLPYYHPFQVALEANACDQLTNGRYMLGVGTGFRAYKAEWRGVDFSKNREMTEDGLRLILKLFNTKEPFDSDSQFWGGKGMQLDIPPVQLPHPPVAISVMNSIESAKRAGSLGLLVLTADFTPSAKIKEIGDGLEAGQAAAGRKVSRDPLRTCRVVYVAETDQQARDDMRASYSAVIAWEKVNTPHHQKDRIPPGGTLDDITYDYLIDSGNLFIGAPETVRQMIENFYANTGGFGLLMLHAGRDYATPDKLANSMKLLARDVRPHLDLRLAA